MNDPQFLKYPDDRYIWLTGETMKGVASIVIGFTGPSASKVAEVAEPVGRLPGEIVEYDDLPDEWKDAFRAVGLEVEEVEEEVGCADCEAAQQRIAELELDCSKYRARLSCRVVDPMIPANFWCVTSIATVTMMAVMYLCRNG